MTGFFGNPKTDCSSPCQQWAGRLAALMLKARRTDKVNLRVWVVDFCRLRKLQTDAEIEHALSWLEQHAQDEFCPKVFSASSFRRKFDKIQAAMNRGTDKWDSLPEVEVTSDARKVSRNLGGLIWPGAEKQDELKAIQVSLDNYRVWLNSLRAAKVSHPDQIGLLDCLLALGGDPLGFVEAWFARLHRSAWEVEGWAGKLGRHVVKTDSPKFQKIINGWLQEYLGQGEHWERLEKLLKEGDRK